MGSTSSDASCHPRRCRLLAPCESSGYIAVVRYLSVERSRFPSRHPEAQQLCNDDASGGAFSLPPHATSVQPVDVDLLEAMQPHVMQALHRLILGGELALLLLFDDAGCDPWILRATFNAFNFQSVLHYELCECTRSVTIGRVILERQTIVRINLHIKINHRSQVARPCKSKAGLRVSKICSLNSLSFWRMHQIGIGFLACDV
jgi:hypothetical protein